MSRKSSSERNLKTLPKKTRRFRFHQFQAPKRERSVGSFDMSERTPLLVSTPRVPKHAFIFFFDSFRDPRVVHILSHLLHHLKISFLLWLDQVQLLIFPKSEQVIVLLWVIHLTRITRGHSVPLQVLVALPNLIPSLHLYPLVRLLQNQSRLDRLTLHNPFRSGTRDMVFPRQPAPTIPRTPLMNGNQEQLIQAQMMSIRLLLVLVLQVGLWGDEEPQRVILESIEV